MGLLRIRDLLGADPRTASWSQWSQLVTQRTPEHFDLDFKSTFYPHQKKTPQDAAREVALDAASFANGQGGVIVIGIKDVNDEAAEITEVEFSKGEQQWMAQAVATHAFPKPDYEFVEVKNPERPTHGLLIWVIPESRLAPHAVQEDERLRYVTRGLKDKRWLSEYEVAEKYRERFARSGRSLERLAELESHGNAHNGCGPFVLTSVLMPTRPGSLTLSKSLLSAIQTRTWNLPQQHVLRSAVCVPTVGHRRYLLRQSDRRVFADQPFHGEMLTDGSGYFAASVGDSQVAGKPVLHRGRLLWLISESLRLLRAHAIECGADGDAIIRVAIRSSGADDGYIPPLSLGYLYRAHFPREPLLATSQPNSEVVIPLQANDREFLLAVRAVMTDLYQCFGEAEVELINADGFIDGQAWRDATDEHPRDTARLTSAFGLGDLINMERL